MIPYVRPALLALLVLVSACGGTDRAARPSAAVPPYTASATTPAGYTYPPGDSVRVVTWNVEHFVDAYDNPYVDADREDEPGDVEARVALLAEALRRLDADVVVLQEFEGAAFAERFAATHVPELGYTFVAGTESPDWYQNVVVLSRLPLGVVRQYASVETPVEGETDEAGRPATQHLTNNRLWVADVLARPGYSIALAGLHLKAGRGARNEGWRRGQIRFLKDEFARLLALAPDQNILVAGDLNALRDSEEIALFLAPEGPVRLVDPAEGQTLLTHPSEAPERQLDYLLVNDELLPELVPGSVDVLRPLPPGEMEALSDHLPIGATFIARDR